MYSDQLEKLFGDLRSYLFVLAVVLVALSGAAGVKIGLVSCGGYASVRSGTVGLIALLFILLAVPLRKAKAGWLWVFVLALLCGVVFTGGEAVGASFYPDWPGSFDTFIQRFQIHILHGPC